LHRNLGQKQFLDVNGHRPEKEGIIMAWLCSLETMPMTTNVGDHRSLPLDLSLMTIGLSKQLSQVWRTIIRDHSFTFTFTQLPPTKKNNKYTSLHS